MNWSMLEPDDPPVCECKYDEARDVMDREDCPFHCDLVDEVQPKKMPEIERKRAALTRSVDESAA
jgi:hypothetical protein